MKSEYKITLAPVTLANAGGDARKLLENAKSSLGFIPNMYGLMANSPGLLETYLGGYDRFRKGSGFSATEQEVVLLTISRTNGCDYCVAAHSFVADRSKIPAEVTEAIRVGTQIGDAKLSVLSVFTEKMVSTRGLPSKADVQAFLDGGYTERHMLEVILAISVKTLSNYANHVLHTPLDEVFAGRAWDDAA